MLLSHLIFRRWHSEHVNLALWLFEEPLSSSIVDQRFAYEGESHYSDQRAISTEFGRQSLKRAGLTSAAYAKRLVAGVAPDGRERSCVFSRPLMIARKVRVLIRLLHVFLGVKNILSRPEYA